MRCRCLLLVVLACCTFARGQDYIIFDAAIAGKPARMALDTGSSRTILYRTAAIRLGLRIFPPLTVQNVAEFGISGITERVDFRFGSTITKEEFLVMDLSQGIRMEFDGMIGWAPIRDTRLLFRGGQRRLETPRDLPDDIGKWVKLPVRRANVLLLEITMEDGTSGVFLVDTGSTLGLQLDERQWNNWVSKHPDQPESMGGFFTPSAGIVHVPERWASEFKIGPITFRDVPISQNKVELRDVPDHLGTIGLAALLRVDFLVDGEENVAYLESLSTPPLPYAHNRLGATFIPRSSTDDTLVAHVGRNSPATRAGIRDGDILLRIEQLDVTKWRTDSKVMPLSRFFEMSAGTKLNLTLQRNGQEMAVPVTLEDIIGPTTQSN